MCLLEQFPTIVSSHFAVDAHGFETGEHSNLLQIFYGNLPHSDSADDLQRNFSSVV